MNAVRALAVAQTTKLDPVHPNRRIPFRAIDRGIMDGRLPNAVNVNRICTGSVKHALAVKFMANAHLISQSLCPHAKKIVKP